MQEEPVTEDLKEEILRYYVDWDEHPQYVQTARHFAEWQEAQMIDKACEWLKSHYRDYMYNPTGERLEAFFGGDMCNDFENYMMEK